MVGVKAHVERNDSAPLLALHLAQHWVHALLDVNDLVAPLREHAAFSAGKPGPARKAVPIGEPLINSSDNVAVRPQCLGERFENAANLFALVLNK